MKKNLLRRRLNWLKINLKTNKKGVREKRDVNMNMLYIYLKVEAGKIDGKGIRSRNPRHWTKVVLIKKTKKKRLKIKKTDSNVNCYS